MVKKVLLVMDDNLHAELIEEKQDMTWLEFVELKCLNQNGRYKKNNFI